MGGKETATGEGETATGEETATPERATSAKAARNWRTPSKEGKTWYVCRFQVARARCKHISICGGAVFMEAQM